MKSIDIINYIDSLNEDAYSKYTVGQIYQKLGHDKFMSYAKNIIMSAMRRLNTESPIKTMVPEMIRGEIIKYEVKIGRFREEFLFSILPSTMDLKFGSFHVKYGFSDRIGKRQLSYRSYFIDEHQKDFPAILNRYITTIYDQYAEYRDPHIDAPTNRTKLEDYDNYPVYKLFVGVQSKKLLPYIVDCAIAALKTCDYEPMVIDQETVDLRKERPAAIPFRRGYSRVAFQSRYKAKTMSLEEIAMDFYLTEGHVDIFYHIRNKYIAGQRIDKSELQKPIPLTLLLKEVLNRIFNNPAI